MPTPVLHLVVGSNGAGKSSFIADVLIPETHLPLVNADDIAAKRWPADAEARSYDAAAIAERERARLIRSGTSFIAETVFSHESKLALLDDAQAAGFIVALHVVMVPVNVTVMRVEDRIANGGHSVPEDKVRSRYQRLWDLVATAMRRADEANVYDNSSAAHPFREVARFVRGQPIGKSAWPRWTPKPLRLQ